MENLWNHICFPFSCAIILIRLYTYDNIMKSTLGGFELVAPDITQRILDNDKHTTRHSMVKD